MIYRSVHIEFYGLPGCGKSTISERIAKRFESNGISVLQASAKTGNETGKVKRVLIKLARTLTVSKNYKQDMLLFREIVNNNGYSSYQDVFKQVINLAQKDYYYKKKSDSLFMWDEGLLQAAISLSVNNSRDCSKNVSELLEIVQNGARIIPVYLKMPIDSAISNMNQRRTNNSRVEKIKDYDSKVLMLKKYELACSQIDICGTITVCTEGKTIEQISDVVWSELEDRL